MMILHAIFGIIFLGLAGAYDSVKGDTEIGNLFIILMITSAFLFALFGSIPLIREWLFDREIERINQHYVSQFLMEEEQILGEFKRPWLSGISRESKVDRLKMIEEHKLLTGHLNQEIVAYLMDR